MALEPFTIHCPTCGSSIRVRNPKLIGQIANCPKCQSLIQIAAPDQVTIQPPGANSVDSSAMTREVVAPGEWDATTEGEDAVDDGYRLAPIVAGQENTADSFEGRNADFDEQAASQWQPADAPLVPSEEWASASSAKSRQYLLIGLLGLFGVIVSAGGFVAFLNWYNAAETQSAGTGELAQANGGKPAADLQDAANADAQETGVHGNEPESTAGSSNVSDDVAAADSNVTSNSTGSDDNTQATEVGESAEPLKDRSNTSQSTPADARQDPGADSAIPPSSAADDAGEPAQVEKTNAMSQFEAISTLLEYNVHPTIPDEGIAPSQAPLTAADLGLVSTVERPALQPVDVQEHLEAINPGLILTGSPPRLSHWLNLWTQISGIPTVVDFDLLAGAAVDRNATASLLRWVDVSNRQILEDFAGSISSQFRIVENRYVLLHPSNALLLERLPAELALDGLVTQEDYAWLNDVLVQCFPAAAGNLQLADGHLKLTNRTDDVRTWAEIVQLINSWHAAESKGATTPTGQSVNRFTQPDQVAGLDFKGTLVSPQSRPVGQVLSKICQQADVNCWIDWANVGAVGLGPSTVEVVVTHNRPLRDSLADYAQMFPVVVAVLDDSSLWFTSTAAYRTQVQSYVLPAEGQTQSQWRDQLRDLTPSDGSGVGQLEVHLTPDAQFVLVRCCRPQVKFRSF